MTNSILPKAVTLNDGHRMPILGLGVWQAEQGRETQNAIAEAFKVGYRHIDTARIYNNETDVGHAVRATKIKREEIFITTKLWNDDQGYESGLRAFEGSLKRLAMDYVDLYLIHWPVPDTRLDSWRALCEIKKSGRARSIGVSNFTVNHLKQLIEKSGVVPAVNQVEFHPFLFQKELLDYCRAHKIQLEAYSPLAHGERVNHPAIGEMAKKYSRTPAQIMIRWAIEHEVVVIPKSVNSKRIAENFNVFDFSIQTEDMRRLDGLNENFRTCWDPSRLE